MSVKVCTKCHRELPISEFGKHSWSKDGHAWRCKECSRKQSKEAGRTASGIYSNIKGRLTYAKKHPGEGRGILKKLSISKEDFIEWYNCESKICHYCGVPDEHLGKFLRAYGSRWFRLTIDCKDNDIGYANGNIVLACDKCNMIKNNVLTYDDMCEIGQKYIKPKWMALVK